MAAYQIGPDTPSNFHPSLCPPVEGSTPENTRPTINQSRILGIVMKMKLRASYRSLKCRTVRVVDGSAQNVHFVEHLPGIVVSRLVFTFDQNIGDPVRNHNEQFGHRNYSAFRGGE